MMNTDTWTSKKFVLTLVVFITGTVFLVVNRATFEQWKSLTEWLFGGYLFANVGETAVKGLTK